MPRGRDDRRETRESFHIRLPVSVLRHLHTIAGRQTAEHGRRISAQDLVQDLIAREWGDPDAR
jgi:hypothetical protein